MAQSDSLEVMKLIVWDVAPVEDTVICPSFLVPNKLGFQVTVTVLPPTACASAAVTEAGLKLDPGRCGKCNIIG